MLSEVNIAGIFVAPIAVYAAAAVLLFLICHRVLRYFHVLQNTWHPGLFELALYVALLCVLVLAV
jgi:protein AaeX